MAEDVSVDCLFWNKTRLLGRVVRGFAYNKFLCQFLSGFSPVALEEEGGDDFAWKQVARIVIILIFF